MLYVDDAHGFGVLQHGHGAAASLPATARAAQVVMITLARRSHRSAESSSAARL